MKINKMSEKQVGKALKKAKVNCPGSKYELELDKRLTSIIETRFGLISRTGQLLFKA